MHAETNTLKIMTGQLLYTYEWVVQLFTEFGVSPGDGFQLESPPFHTQGPCLVAIHSQVGLDFGFGPNAGAALAEAAERSNTSSLLVFLNTTDAYGPFGTWRHVAGDSIECMPQDLGSFAFNILTATTVYLRYRHKIRWHIRNYLFASDELLNNPLPGCR
jgi:hypothetical protein